jgi:DUF917 family protein
MKSLLPALAAAVLILPALAADADARPFPVVRSTSPAATRAAPPVWSQAAWLAPWWATR